MCVGGLVSPLFLPDFFSIVILNWSDSAAFVYFSFYYDIGTLYEYSELQFHIVLIRPKKKKLNLRPSQHAYIDEDPYGTFGISLYLFLRICVNWHRLTIYKYNTWEFNYIPLCTVRVPYWLIDLLMSGGCFVVVCIDFVSC